jgi:hypothetical protein
VVVLIVGGWTAVRLSRRADARAEATDAALAATPTARPVIETEPGFNLAEQDDLELLYSMPAYTGLDRLRDAIRNEQQKGEQA